MSQAKQQQYNVLSSRYSVVKLARQWISVLKRMDDFRHFSQSEIIKKAISDITSGDVTPEDIAKARSKMKPAAEQEDDLKLASKEESGKNGKSKK
ncbi:MAG: hypothetical protein JW803_00755 [Endomicrobiales bacterium]|nr:hypothetical protein [Endomicrobiales bacterium]